MYKNCKNCFDEFTVVYLTGITYTTIAKDEYEEKLLENAIKTSVRLWVETLKEIYTYRNQYQISPNFSCESRQNLQQWRDGEFFYQ